ncbi:MAG TPA: hypothetical protein VGZ89_03335, partial [Xanthobacteraceae bacterium]|nr:hypothetical protein [Xanthobacteraceae bacterium]
VQNAFRGIRSATLRTPAASVARQAFQVDHFDASSRCAAVRPLAAFFIALDRTSLIDRVYPRRYQQCL